MLKDWRWWLELEQLPTKDKAKQGNFFSFEPKEIWIWSIKKNINHISKVLFLIFDLLLRTSKWISAHQTQVPQHSILNSPWLTHPSHELKFLISEISKEPSGLQLWPPIDIQHTQDPLSFWYPWDQQPAKNNRQTPAQPPNKWAHPWRWAQLFIYVRQRTIHTQHDGSQPEYLLFRNKFWRKCGWPTCFDPSC